MDCSLPAFSVRHHLSEFAQVHVHCIGHDIQPSNPLIPSFLSPLNLSSIRDFANESAVCIRWSKYWSFSFSISPSNEYSGLISLKIVWFDLLAVQRTLRSLFQHHSLEAWILALWLYWFQNIPLHLVTEKIAWLILGKRHGIFLEWFLRKNSKE